MQEAQIIEPELVGMLPFCGVHVKLNHQNLPGTCTNIRVPVLEKYT